MEFSLLKRHFCFQGYLKANPSTKMPHRHAICLVSNQAIISVLTNQWLLKEKHKIKWK